ncbi:MAG: AEC family transporter [Cyclobacteriaceae bacterium]|nr:AEC family transporter [Cyclobacteriaceae bacterium]MCH8516855.1 AEC family transporter [Cyclobacteriaceae bacterium]
MDSILTIFICLLVGFLFQRVKDFPENSHLVLNQYIIYFALPALAFLHIPSMELGLSSLMPVAGAWLVILFAFLFFKLLQKPLNLDRNTFGALLMCSAFGNTSFIGLPVLEALYGDEGVKAALLFDQPGSFVAICTVGISIASIYSSGQAPSAGQFFKRIFTFPPFLGFIVAVSLNIFQIPIPELMSGAAAKIATTITPIALVSIGFQLRLSMKEVKISELIAPIGFKLIIAPLLIFLLYSQLVSSPYPVDMKASVIQAGTGPMVTACIIATSYGLRPKLVSMILGIGILLSFISMAGWYIFLEQF